MEEEPEERDQEEQEVLNWKKDQLVFFYWTNFFVLNRSKKQLSVRKKTNIRYFLLECFAGFSKELMKKILSQNFENYQKSFDR